MIFAIKGIRNMVVTGGGYGIKDFLTVGTVGRYYSRLVQ